MPLTCKNIELQQVQQVLRSIVTGNESKEVSGKRVARVANTEGKPEMTTAKEVRAAFHEAIIRHGGRRTGGYYAVPVGNPVEGRQPWLSFRLNPNGYGPAACTIILDRWNASDPPETAPAWLEENLYPFVKSAVLSIRKGNYWMTLPGVSSFTSATVLRSDVAAVLAVWIPQEKQWHQQQATPTTTHSNQEK